MNETNACPAYFETPLDRTLFQSAETLIQPPSGAALPPLAAGRFRYVLAANDRFVVVRQGVRTNQQVILNPNRFDSQVEFPPPLPLIEPKAATASPAPSATSPRPTATAGVPGGAPLSTARP